MVPNQNIAMATIKSLLVAQKRKYQVVFGKLTKLGMVVLPYLIYFSINSCQVELTYTMKEGTTLTDQTKHMNGNSKKLKGES